MILTMLRDAAALSVFMAALAAWCGVLSGSI